MQLNREGLKRRMELLAVTAQKAVDPQAAMRMLKDALGVGQAQQVIDAYKSRRHRDDPCWEQRMAALERNLLGWRARSRTARKNSN